LSMLMLLLAVDQVMAKTKKVNIKSSAIIVGTSSDNPPYEYTDAGDIVGFDIAIIKEIGRELGRQIVIKDYEFPTLVAAVVSGKVDVAIANISPSPERAKNVEFSRVYYREPLVLIYHGKNGEPESLDDLTVGVQFGSTYEQALYRYNKINTNFKVASRPALATLISDLENGRVNVLITTLAHARRVVGALPSYAYTEFELPGAPLVESAIVAAKGNALIKDINTAIASLESRGVIDQLAGQWFDPSITTSRSSITDKILFIISGVKITLLYSLVSVIIGLIFGTGLALTHVSSYKLLQKFASIYVSIFRGTPVLVQLFLIHYGVPSLLGIKISPLFSGILTFSLNSSAYVSEIVKGGIRSVDKGQYEAARALGVPYRLCMRDIILPQAFRKVLPSLVNEVIDLMKESSLLALIGEVEMMRRAQIIAAETYDYFTPLLLVAICYYSLVTILAKAAKRLEKWLSYDRS
ncbi:MAG: ABC transporter substrate-binding protein/permease, partial [Pseudomonadota bacterium]